MPTTSSDPHFRTRDVAIPTILVGVLIVSLSWRIQRPVEINRSALDRYADIIFWLSLPLAGLNLWHAVELSRRRAELLAELRTQAERIDEDVIDQIAEAVQRYAIFMIDPQGYVLSWDRAAERLLGYTTAEVNGRHISLFYSEPDARQEKPGHDLAEATISGRSDDDCWLVRKDGFHFKANVAIVAIRDPDGALCGFTNVVREDASNPAYPESSLSLY
jgi:PAS domain S-box-containing protein